MSRPRFLRSVVTGLGLAILATACSPDRLTAPAAPSSTDATVSRSLLSGLLGAISPSGQTVVSVIGRTHALDHDISVTRTIGYYGGTIEIPEAGLTVRFARGAVRQNTAITATAYAGSYVSYGFAPHGLQFAAPVTVTQDMDMTTVQTGLLSGLLNLSSIRGAYVPDGQDGITADGQALVTELLDVQNTLNWVLGILHLESSSFVIHHFSGYILSSGRSSTR